MTWKQTVTNNFDRKATQYAAHNAVQQQVAQHLITLAPPLKNAQILEIGCGDGTFTRLLAAQYPDSQIHATDISPAMLQAAQRNLPNNSIKWQQMDGEAPELSGLPQQYDLIISNMTVQWFQNLPATIQNWQKHLKPGGKILFSRPGDKAFQEWTAALASLSLPSGILPVHPPISLAQEHIITHHYGVTWDFLKSMQSAGALTPKAGYQPLTAKQLKQACALCDSQSNGSISWHIYYESISGT